MREVAEVVVVGNQGSDILDAEVIEAQRFEQHLVDSGAANHSVVSDVVVVGLEEEGLLLRLFDQLFKTEQVVLCELASSLFVGVDPADSVTIKTGSTIFLGLVGLSSFFGLGLLLVGETEEGLVGECGVGKKG